jgi:membrane-bound serine protease (ClpP class)
MKPRVPVRFFSALALLGAGGAGVLLPGSSPQVEAAMGAQVQQGPRVVWVVPVEGVIELGLAPFVERSLREASAAGASAVVLDIDTPGGRVDAAERIADALQDAGVPTYAYINRRAFSAGALISLATDGIYMRPGSVIGAATPVVGDEKAPEKIVSAMRSEMRALAEARGLDPRVAEAMVDEEIAIEGIVEEGKLLSLTAEEAVGLGFAAAVEDLPGLFAEVGLQGAETVQASVNWAERVVRFLSHPVVAPFLLSLGFLGLIAEIKTPGLGLAGLAGALSLALFFGSHLIIGLAGWGDLLLFGLGVVLLVVELIALPGFGLLGIAGALAMGGGLFMAMIGAIPTMADFTRAGGVLSTSILLMIVSAWAVLRHLPRSQRLVRSGVLLMSSTPREGGYASAVLRTDLVGREGVAITDLRPSGVALVGDERVDVVAEAGWIEEGSPVAVVSSEGYRHVVRALSRDSREGSTTGQAVNPS